MDEDAPPPPGPASEPSQAERLAFVKFARYTALTADKLSGALIALSEKLEQAGILDPNRTSRVARDQKLKAHMHRVSKSDQAVADLLKLIPDHPDGEALIRSLFHDLQVPSVRLRPSGSAAAPHSADAEPSGQAAESEAEPANRREG